MKINILATSLLLVTSTLVHAGSATWSATPTSGEWNTAANWVPMVVPNGQRDVATFDTTSNSTVSFSSFTTLESIVFDPTASAYSISINFNQVQFQGAGIVNNSAQTQNFILPTNSFAGASTMDFFHSGTVSAGTTFTVAGSTVAALSGGLVNFWDKSNAGEATFVLQNESNGVRTIGGQVAFHDSASAGSANITCQAGGDSNFGGTVANVAFFDQSRAGTATLTAQGSTSTDNLPGVVAFEDNSSAEQATLIATGVPFVSGGAIFFTGNATGARASVQLVGNGLLELNSITPASLTIGSLAGDGTILLGNKNLTIGQNNADTVFRGTTEQTTTGSITKIGRGRLIFSGANTYSGGTTVQAGRLLTNNTSGSATGTGPVTVIGGGFGGNGTVTGAVTIGDGTAVGATLVAGLKTTGLFTINNSLTMNANSQYQWKLETNGGTSDEVSAKGATIDPAASFVAVAHGETALPSGTIFLVLNNTASTPISGTFANLPDEGTITVGGNILEANYEGGDGNDLTLTVVE